MCGIFGAVSSTDVQKDLIDGLSKLEYRGYDSAGLSLISKSKKMKIALCTYHANDDFSKYSTLLQKYNYNISHSNGFMIFYWDKKIDKPYLRRGVLRAEKN